MSPVINVGILFITTEVKTTLFPNISIPDLILNPVIQLTNNELRSLFNILPLLIFLTLIFQIYHIISNLNSRLS